MASFGALSQNMGFYPSSDRIVEFNAQTLESGTWRQIIQQTNIPPIVDLDRTYMDGGGTPGGSRGADSCFFLGASLLSNVPHIGCDSVGYLQ